MAFLYILKVVHYPKLVKGVGYYLHIPMLYVFIEFTANFGANLVLNFDLLVEFKL